MRRLEESVNSLNFSTKGLSMKLQPLPKLQPIMNLSPTMFATLKKCQLQAGLRNARAQQTTRSSTAALLGTISHRVLENARFINRDNKDLRTQAEAMWDKTAGEVEEQLRTSPLDKHLLPINKWRRYYLLRERTIRRCEEIASSQMISENQVIASERKFDSVKYGFTGKPDLILRQDDGLVIIDYKSGELPDESEDRQEKIAMWQQQVLFYAAIIKEELGEWPVDGEIRLLNNEIVPIQIDQQKAEALIEETQAVKTDYNEKIAAGVSHLELAQYSEDNCIFCEYKGNCDTFWQNNPQPIPGTDKYGCLSGKIKNITTTEKGSGRLVIDSENPNEASQQWEITDLTIKQFENLKELIQGDFVKLIDFLIDSESCQAKPIQTSIIWKVS